MSTKENELPMFNDYEKKEQPAAAVQPKTPAANVSTQSQPPQKAPITLDDNGLIAPKDFDQMSRFCTVLAQSGMLPKQYDTAAKVMAGMQFARELGLKPLIGLKSIAVINGTPSLHTDGPLAIVMASGLLESINEYLLDDEYKPVNVENKNLNKKPVAAVCEVKRRGFEIKTTTFPANQAPKKPGPWTEYFEIMMKRRCRGIALKDIFPDVLNGIAIAEYDHDTLITGDGSVVDSTTVKRVSNINEAFSEQETQT